MKVSKAIEILVLNKTCEFEGDAKDLEDALQLGIGALRFYLKLNASNTGEIQGNFIGETPEKEV